MVHTTDSRQRRHLATGVDNTTVDTVDSRHQRHLATDVDNTTTRTTTATSNDQQYVSSVSASSMGNAQKHR